MPVNKSTITFQREDFSRFVIHLTRNDEDDFLSHGSPASENLETILKQKTVKALRPHCLHKNKLKSLGAHKKILKQFNVACFTEVPLSQIHLLTQPIDGVAYQREPYGLVFKRSALVRCGAQPAIYVNSYNGNDIVYQSFNEVFENAVKCNWTNDGWKMLPFVNAMHEKYDFTWEREWRTNFDFKFLMADLVAIILPPVGEEGIRDKASERGIPCISPGWTYEMIIQELSSQQKKTRRVVRENSVI